MSSDRMSNADMIQYCDEALAWEDFGFFDRYFFESVKKILLGECSAIEEPEDNHNGFADIKRPVTSAELEPEYKNFPDEYYISKDKSENIPEENDIPEEDLFGSSIFSEGFFVIAPDGKKYSNSESSEKSGRKKDNTGFTVKI